MEFLGEHEQTIDEWKGVRQSHATPRLCLADSSLILLISGCEGAPASLLGRSLVHGSTKGITRPASETPTWASGPSP